MACSASWDAWPSGSRSEEHTSELQSQSNLVCRLLLEKKNTRPAHAGARATSPHPDCGGLGDQRQSLLVPDERGCLRRPVLSEETLPLRAGALKPADDA